MNLNINIPAWMAIILATVWTIERLVVLISSKPFQNLWYRAKILFLYHNDEEYYKQKLASKKAKQALCRERYQHSGKYDATSLADLADKKREK
jgi:hypothetical protein